MKDQTPRTHRRPKANQPLRGLAQTPQPAATATSRVALLGFRIGKGPDAPVIFTENPRRILG